jgi:diguanylate cyclase (GGDEF)-like protein/PAS domain S-box-containing protein
MARNEEVDLVICQVSVRDPSGFEICTKMRADPVLHLIPVILMGDPVEALQVRAFECGGSDYIVQPLNFTLLAARVRAILKYRRAVQALRAAHAQLEDRVRQRTEELSRTNVKLQSEVVERRKAEDALREGGERMKKLIEHMDALYLYDSDGRVVMVNEAACEQLGYSREELLGLTLRDIVAEFNPQALGHVWAQVEPGRAVLLQDVYLRKDRSKFPVETRNGLLELGGRKLMLCIARDVTERHRQEAALRESEERYALAAKGANDGLWDWNLRAQEIYFSPRWKAMIGRTPDEIGTSPDEWFKRVHPEDLEALRAEIAAHLSGDSAHLEKEYRILHKDGTYRWMLSRGMAVVDSGKTPSRMVGSQTDITSRKAAELQVRHDAFYDILTGLPNRALFIDRVKQAMQRSARAAESRFGVVFLAINRFDVVNDSLGHKFGDRLLMDISHRLTQALRAGDTVARLGGAEFAILLEHTESNLSVEGEAARLQQELVRQFLIGSQEVFIQCSMGIVLNHPSYGHAEEMLRDADTAMRRAKELDKRCLVFQPGMHAKAVSVLQLEGDLRRALERQEFVLHYQPIVALDTGKLVGVEALIRWQKPGGKLIPPMEFIPLAEENRLIIPLSWWVLREACRQMNTWKRSGACNGLSYVNVNLSSKMFVQPNLVALVRKTIEETGLAPGSLKLELTESVLMEYGEAVSSVLQRLKDLQVHLVLDDFGTGYSSLSYLHRFPIDVLKIDRSFVSAMDKANSNTEIVRTIVSLAENLKMDSVAEGVETKEQQDLLKTLRCRHVQGFLYSKPVPADQLTLLLKEHPAWCQ